MTEYNYKRFSPSNYDYGSFSGPKPGEVMLDFALCSLDGKEAKLTDFRGQWVVLETGSLTCPMYVKNIDSIKGGLHQEDKELLIDAIYRCCAEKAEIVSVDERESGVRRLLNLGHTFGHGIENALGYGTYLHG